MVGRDLDAVNYHLPEMGERLAVRPGGLNVARDTIQKGRYDVVVVGAGMSGLEAACELAGAGLSVLVLESGLPGFPIAGTRSPPRWSTASPPHYSGPGFQPIVGGRSLRWHGVVLRIEEWALAEPWWPDTVREALQGSGMHGLYAEVEADLARWKGCSLDDAAGADEDSVVAALGAWAAAPACVVPRAVRKTAAAPPGVGAYSPLARWNDGGRDAQRSGCADLRAGVETLEVLVRRGRVLGVRFADKSDGSVVDVPTGAVVAAAGTIENTRLVAQTGVGGEVFAGLHDHLVQGFVARLPSAKLALENHAEGFAMVKGEPADRSNLFARIAPIDPSGPDLLLDAWTMGEQLGGGEVRFAVGATKPWPVTVVPRLGGTDLAVLDRQRALLTKVWDAIAQMAGVTSQMPDIPDLWRAPVPFETARAQATETATPTPTGYSWPLGTVDHEGGTLPLGIRLDDRGQVLGVRGLFVAGPGAFPRQGAANPSLTILALARWTARAIVQG